MKVCILDYGSGNIASVYNIINFLGYECKITNETKHIKSSSHIILPGVGSYAAAMKKLKKADKFRDPRVWSIKNKQWYKDNIWGGESAYGYVYLDKKEIDEFNEKKKKLNNRKI